MSIESLLLEYLNKGEIFDFEEYELFESEDDDYLTFEAFLDSKKDF